LKQIGELKSKLDQVTEYNDWSNVAIQIDTLEGKDKWKNSDASGII
jgi:hypothetical protein